MISPSTEPTNPVMTPLIRPATCTDLRALALLAQRDTAWVQYVASKQQQGTLHLLLAEVANQVVGFVIYRATPHTPSGQHPWLYRLRSMVEEQRTAGEPATLALPTSAGFLQEVFVGKSYRRQGVGRALVQAAVVALTTMAVQTAQVSLDPNDEHAQHLFLQLGFRPHRVLVERELPSTEPYVCRVSRPAVWADLPQLVELVQWEVRYQRRLARSLHLHTRIDWESYVAAKLRRRDVALLVVERNGRLVGYSELWVMDPDRCTLRQRLATALRTPAGWLWANRSMGERIGVLEDIYVLPAWRKTGLALALFEDCAHWFRQQQITRVQGSIWHANEVSLRIADQIGAKVIELIMYRPLGESRGNQ
jgi:ribosomal protein S18 acetylase RimI-like enzyme